MTLNIFHCSIFAAVVMGMLLTERNTTTVAGFRVLLSCNVTSQHSDNVIWLNPSAIPVSSGYNVTESDTRLKVIGSPVSGEYHLLIKYTQYPQDVGIWNCISLSNKSVQRTRLTLLVPPATEVKSIVICYKLHQLRVKVYYFISVL
jgi:hypothetical protein